MNAEKLLSLGLLTVMVVTTPFATFNSASANDNVANSTVTSTYGQTEMLLLAGKGKEKEKSEHTSKARPSTQEKHEKGQAAKKSAEENKQYKEAKKEVRIKI